MLPRRSLKGVRKAKSEDASPLNRDRACPVAMGFPSIQGRCKANSTQIRWLLLVALAICSGIALMFVLRWLRRVRGPGFSATELLDRARWQQGNVSQSLFPDGHPVKHFDSKNSVVWGMAERQQWEAETFRVFRSILTDKAARRPGAWVIDLGGWIGITGLYAAQFAQQVLAFEPDPAARSELVANVWLNPLFEPRVRVIDKCVSHERSTVTMKGDPGASWSSILFFDDKGTLEHWQVECMPLQAHLDAAGIDGKDVVFLKMDIEGAEATVLPALRGWLADNGKPPVLVSMHRWLWQDRPAAEAGLLSVFQDYAHVYNSALDEVPRASLTAEWMAAADDPAFLLTNKAYDFPPLHAGLFAEQGGYLPPPDSARLRGSWQEADPVEQDAENEVGVDDSDLAHRTDDDRDEEVVAGEEGAVESEGAEPDMDDDAELADASATTDAGEEEHSANQPEDDDDADNGA